MDNETRKGLRELRDDRSSGAHDLALKGLELMARYVEKTDVKSMEEALGALRWIAGKIGSIRPSMAPLQSVAAGVEKAGVNLIGIISDPAEFVESLKREMDQIAENLKNAGETAAENALSVLEGKRAVMTHSRSATMTHVFDLLPGRDILIYATESRPGGEGVRAARDLLERGFRVTLVPDMNICHFLPEADLVLVGADSILKDGSVVNKAGTQLLALAAKSFGKPFYVVADSFKRRADCRVFLEEMPPEEITNFEHSHLTVRNYYFDRTPAELITEIITEE